MNFKDFFFVDKYKKYPLKFKKRISLFGNAAINKLLKDYDFATVLDIGSGEGLHSEIFLNAGKKVTAIDYGKSEYFKKKKNNIDTIVADFNKYEFDRKFDCVWCCHVLEHQINVNFFLKKIYSLLNDGGILAITVPPAKSLIVGGHVSIWNAGILLYNLVLAGFDCSDAAIKSVDYDISIIVRKQNVVDLNALEYDTGDIKKIRQYLPSNLAFFSKAHDTPFEGNIKEINWNL